MQDFLIMLLICSVTMSALALVYIAATPFLARYYSVTGRYYTWLVIVAGLIIPFRPHINNAIVTVNMPGGAAVPVIGRGSGAPAAVAIGYTPHTALAAISWWQIAAAVWLAGMIVFLSYHVIRHYRFLKLAARWSKDITDKQTLSIMQNLKNQMGVTKNIRLQNCDSIGSPMMTGFVNPRILLPKADFAKDELSLILKHELIHYKRKDLWYKCLVLLAAAVHWFNPIVYLMANVIDIQCELSCDQGVVRGTGADMRLYYSETIIGVVRYKSKLKTALSTNFYGGRKAMRKRIVSIMDMGRKKAGLAILVSVLILTLGTGFAFAANKETQVLSPTAADGIKEDITEDIKVSPEFDFAYRFLPDPELYSQYSSYGISISEDGKMLLYNGQRVRLFVDEHADVPAFFLDETGTLDLTADRNTAGSITGIKSISRAKAQEYRSSFFADDMSVTAKTQGTAEGWEAVKDTVTVQDTVMLQDTIGGNKYEQYGAYGITRSADGNVLYYNGQRVRLFVDMLSDGSFETYWTDEAGTVNLSVARNSAGEITAIESISEEAAGKYQSSSDEYEKNILGGVEENVAGRMKELFPENE